MHSCDVIVVGTGGMGAAAAWHLARRGARVLGLDRFPIAHDRGSSHGQTRLIRMAYYEHPDYVPLLRLAYERWRELERETARRLLVESGLLMVGPPAGDLIAGCLRSAAMHGVPIEPLTVAEARGRWPAFQMPDDWAAVHEPRGGYLFVEDCVAAHAAAAVRAGADLRSGVTVHDWRVTGKDVAVHTDAGVFTARRLVLCPGPWAGGLLHLPTAPLTVLRKSLFWHTAGTAVAAMPLPCFAFDTPSGFYYGFPPLDGRGFKVAEHTGGVPVADPLDVDRSLDRAEQERVGRFLAVHLPMTGGAWSDHATCLYTMSADGHFLLGLHPRHPAVSLAAGFSGHGFKFASAVGTILADLAIDGTTAAPIGFLAPDRAWPPAVPPRDGVQPVH